MEIQRADRRMLRKIKKIYLQSFPKAERKPYSLMCRKARQGVMDLLAITQGREVVGMAFLARYQDLVLLDYFAISGQCRGQHIGSEALRQLQRYYGDRRFLLEIELIQEGASNLEQRIRRKEFYLRGGMKETGIRAVLCGVPMELLSLDCPVTFEEYYGIYAHVINPVFARKFVRMEEERE